MNSSLRKKLEKEVTEEYVLENGMQLLLLSNSVKRKEKSKIS
jgi:hypothetical protein